MKSDQIKKLLNTLSILLIGLLVGALVLAVAGFNPLEVFSVLIKGVFGSPKSISYTIIKSTPIIGTALAISFAYQAGLFNIGAEGQFIMGTVTATALGILLPLPPFFSPLVILLCAAIVGGLWGALSGILKAKLGINEVLSGIMLNWIALYFRNFMVSMKWMEKISSSSLPVRPEAHLDFLESWRASEAGKEAISKSPFLNDIFKTEINWGIIIILIIAVIFAIILKKTTLGYRIKAVGANHYCAEYAGINVPSHYATAMFISGAAASVAGCILVLGVSHNISILVAMEGYGFDGIAAALVGGISALGSVLAGLLFAVLKYGGSKIQLPPLVAPTEVINIIIGIIILFAGMPRLLESVTKKLKKVFGKKDKVTLIKAAGIGGEPS